MNASPPRSQPRGVAALAHYVEMRTKEPLLNLGESVHSIHLGTEYAAEINFFDIADTVNSHATLTARNRDLEARNEKLAADLEDAQIEIRNLGNMGVPALKARNDALHENNVLAFDDTKKLDMALAQVSLLRTALEIIEGAPFSMVNDSESLRHTIKSLQATARYVLSRINDPARASGEPL